MHRLMAATLFLFGTSMVPMYAEPVIDPVSVGIGLVTGATIAGAFTHWYHTSAHAEQERENKEVAIVEKASLCFQDVLKRCQGLPCTGCTYGEIVSTYRGGEFERMYAELPSVHSELLGAQSELSPIAGAALRDGKPHKAYELFQNIVHYTALIDKSMSIADKIEKSKYQPLREIAHFSKGIYSLELLQTNSVQLITHVKDVYGAAETGEGLKGFSLICGAEDILRHRTKVVRWIDQLQNHMTQAQGDDDVQPIVVQLQQWDRTLEAIHKIITGHSSFHEETNRYNVKRESLHKAEVERANARADCERAEAEHLRAAAELERERAAAQRAEADHYAQKCAVQTEKNRHEALKVRKKEEENRATGLQIKATQEYNEQLRLENQKKQLAIQAAAIELQRQQQQPAMTVAPPAVVQQTPFVAQTGSVPTSGCTTITGSATNVGTSTGSTSTLSMLSPASSSTLSPQTSMAMSGEEEDEEQPGLHK